MSNSEVTYIYDAANKFRAPALAALTADATVGTLPLDKLVDVRPSSQRNKLGAQSYDVVIVVETIDKTTGDEVYTFNAKIGTTLVGSLVVSSTGQHVLKLDAATIEKQSAARDALILDLDVGGTTPSIKFSAWLV
jgi:hypothetical protein